MRIALDAPAIIERLEALGYAQVEIVDTTGSTNTDMVARPQPEHLSVLIAEEQTAGKGRCGRTWIAPRNAQATATVAVHLRSIRPESLGLIPLLTGCALAKATGAQLKWPNDLYIDGKKLGGILVEAIQVQPYPIVAIGFAVNYDLAPEELPIDNAVSYLPVEVQAQGEQRNGTQEHAETNTSADTQNQHEQRDYLDRGDLLVTMLAYLIEDLERFLVLGGSESTVLPRYQQLSCTLGTKVRAILPGEKNIEGTATAIAPDGALVISTDTQTVHVSAGDVEHLR